MILKEILKPQYIIAVDMDGVLINFNKKAQEITGVDVKDGEIDQMDKKTQKEFWSKIVAHIKAGGSFFRDMELLPDAMELWRYVTHYPHFILTAAGKRLPHAEIEKRASVRQYFGDGVRVEVVDSAAAKSVFAKPNVILIDDRVKAINPWIAAGGIGILHTNTASTIQQLRKLGI